MSKLHTVDTKDLVCVYTQGVHAGKGMTPGLGVGMVPRADAACGEAFTDFYQHCHVPTTVGCISIH